MKLTDSKRTVEIRMMVWNGNGYDPDWSNDFFDAGLLQRDEETDAYIVEDVDYCIDQAQEWADEDEDNMVFVDDVETIREEDDEKAYFFINGDVDPSSIYIDSPICISRKQIDWLSREWENPDLISQFHLATAEEIAEYGIDED